MKIPLIINGERAGEVCAVEDGLYMSIRATAEGTAPLMRLWLHGGGETRYLGLMHTENGRLLLERRISRRELGPLVTCAEYASDRSEAERAAEPPTAAEEKTGGAQAERAAEGEAEAAPEEAAKAPEDSDGEGLIWYRTAGGSLTAFDGERMLTALPSKLREKPRVVDLRIIEGKEYIVFRY